MKLDQLVDRCATYESSCLVSVGSTAQREELTFAELGRAADALADRLRAAGVEAGHIVGIQAENSIDWVIWDFALIRLGAVAQAFPAGMAIGDHPSSGRLALIVGPDQPDAVPIESARVATAFPNVADGLERENRAHSLVFSSGTTGRLKGLRISGAGTESVVNSFIAAYEPTSADRHLIFLPISNYQQRLAIYACVWSGADIVLTPYQRVFRTIKEEKPTFLIAPPIFYDTLTQLHKQEPEGVTLADSLGGNVRFLITGMAPIRRSTMDAFRGAGIDLLEAYGTTETGMIAWNTPAHVKPGTVGRFINPGGAQLADDGEVIVTHPTKLSLGYYDSDPEEAVRTFLTDGTIATGDVGRLDDDGYLQLIGRKKDLIVLASGRKIQPAEIEAELATIDGVAEVVVIAGRNASSLAAIVVTTEDAPHRDIERAVESRNSRSDSAMRIARVLFADKSVRSDPQFMTMNMKLNRNGVAEAFLPRLDGE